MARGAAPAAAAAAGLVALGVLALAIEDGAASQLDYAPLRGPRTGGTAIFVAASALAADAGSLACHFVHASNASLLSASAPLSTFIAGHSSRCVAPAYDGPMTDVVDGVDVVIANLSIVDAGTQDVVAGPLQFIYTPSITILALDRTSARANQTISVTAAGVLAGATSCGYLTLNREDFYTDPQAWASNNSVVACTLPASVYGSPRDLRVLLSNNWQQYEGEEQDAKIRVSTHNRERFQRWLRYAAVVIFLVAVVAVAAAVGMVCRIGRNACCPYIRRRKERRRRGEAESLSRCQRILYGTRVAFLLAIMTPAILSLVLVTSLASFTAMFPNGLCPRPDAALPPCCVDPGLNICGITNSTVPYCDADGYTRNFNDPDVFEQVNGRCCLVATEDNLVTWPLILIASLDVAAEMVESGLEVFNLLHRRYEQFAALIAIRFIKVSLTAAKLGFGFYLRGFKSSGLVDQSKAYDAQCYSPQFVEEHTNYLDTIFKFFVLASTEMAMDILVILLLLADIFNWYEYLGDCLLSVCSKWDKRRRKNKDRAAQSTEAQSAAGADGAAEAGSCDAIKLQRLGPSVLGVGTPSSRSNSLTFPIDDSRVQAELQVSPSTASHLA